MPSIYTEIKTLCFVYIMFNQSSPPHPLPEGLVIYSN